MTQAQPNVLSPLYPHSPAPFLPQPQSSSQPPAAFPHPGPPTTPAHLAQLPSSSHQNTNGIAWGAPFPSLHLWPILDTFAMKMIHLPEQQRIKIGRQTNTKTVPGERNAYFDSKVLSRTHAEIWEQGGKMYIRDVKSSNGTFINNERLSPEGMESEPFELKSEDMVEFGIDIVNEDNRTIMHHKVAAKAYCVFGLEDAAWSARELVHYQSQDGRASRRSTGTNGSQAPGQGHGQGMNQLAQMPPVIMSIGGKSGGLSFEHVLHKLQSELARSKETGSELQSLTTAMNDIQDTLGGGLPPTHNGSASQLIPPQFRTTSAEAQVTLASPHGQQAAAFISLQNQLSETQTSLSGQSEKIHHLEGQLGGHETLKYELATIRASMQESKREMDLFFSGSRGRQLGRGTEIDDFEDEEDDARSVLTVTDNDDEARLRERGRVERERHRPSTPESTMNGNSHQKHESPEDYTKANEELVARVQTLSSEIADAVQLSRTLQSQHGEAMAAVRILTERVGVLESGVASRVAGAEQRWEMWRSKFEEGWKKERESWEAERERLRGVVREWEEASRRAHEEEEERELNEGLSEGGFVDEDEEEVDQIGEDGEEGEQPNVVDGWKEVLRPRKLRRRRPSHKATLAIRALKLAAGESIGGGGVNGGSTAEDGVPRLRARRKTSEETGRELARSGSTSTFRGEKEESSESGKESADTLKESLELEDNVTLSGKGGRQARRKKQVTIMQPIPIFTAIVFVAAAGTLYYRHKD